MLSFQKLEVYRCSIEFLARSTSLPQNLPRGHAALAEQLRRAALSIPPKIAEAAGRVSEADGARHDAIARGSAIEWAGPGRPTNLCRPHLCRRKPRPGVETESRELRSSARGAREHSVPRWLLHHRTTQARATARRGAACRGACRAAGSSGGTHPPWPYRRASGCHST